MRISTLTLTGFRCFGPESQVIHLGDLTTFIGANGSGKSAALQALSRLFGLSQAERTLVREDFYLPPGTEWDKVDQAALSLEAQLVFPELAAGNGADAPAACFKHMTVGAAGEAPYCRIRLVGKWQQSNLAEGETEQELLWISSPNGTPAKDEKTSRVHGHERARIHVHYVPAARDPDRQIKNVSGSLLHVLLRSVNWTEAGRNEIAEASDSIRDTFGSEDGVKLIQGAVVARWSQLHDAPEHRDVSIRPLARRLEDLLRQVEATFSPGPAGPEDPIERLSDGERSLFYLAIVTALFDVQEAVASAETEALSKEALAIPILNIIAVEEPENHVAPHYLGRIIVALRKHSTLMRSQVLLSSHSPSILARVEPEEVRYFRTTRAERITVVCAITLPPERSAALKFVREAVRAYPELYFAKFVALGEGDSEEIVLPRLASALDVPIDSSFVSVAPLGGRHVNHFWRLLSALQIPYATLLDLDAGRNGGGWGRIKYALQQLIELGVPADSVLALKGDGTETWTVEELAEMHTLAVGDASELKPWIDHLERFGVFFSEPLDLDFAMLRAFPTTYRGTADGGDGPRIPDDEDKYKAALASATKAVLGDVELPAGLYSAEDLREFFWYRYLFLGRGKPTTHILALSKLSDAELRRSPPSVLPRFVARIRAALSPPATKSDAKS